MMTAEEIAAFLKDKPGTILAGDAAFPGMRPPAKPETVTAAALAARADAGDPAFLPRPLYIRAPDVTIKKSSPDIRAVSPNHARLLTAIHAAGFGDAAWSLAQMQGSLALKTTKGWAAFENGQPVGFILAQILPDQAEILTLAVHPDARRRGIGERLLQKLMELTQGDGNARVFLEVAADNYAAGGLYEKLGFRQFGTRPDYYKRGAARIDAILYERVLSEQ
jgi:ribosomal-protein-alanine N-acetyltransferase